MTFPCYAVQICLAIQNKTNEKAILHINMPYYRFYLSKQSKKLEIRNEEHMCIICVYTELMKQRGLMSSDISF